jgi:predicted nuclease with TOPRIM domain
MKDIRSLLLVLLSFGLVATWAYHLYDKSTYSNRKTEIGTADSAAVIRAVGDSLEKVYAATIEKLDSELNSSYNTSDSLYTRLTTTETKLDSREIELNNKVREANQLKADISHLLKKPDLTNSEIVVARQKIGELEEIVKQLRNEKSALETEKKELTARLDQMSGEVNSLQQTIRRITDENKSMSEKIRFASVFVASSLHFTALHTKSEKEQETDLAKRADKFVASFVLQNNFNDFMSAEVMIVITDPDDHILQNSSWDSGSFDTRAGDKKNYTRKMKFDYTKGEQKALIFTLNVDTLKKGTYTLQIWHNGVLIGEIGKSLS